jgi:protein SCO1/2
MSKKAMFYGGFFVILAIVFFIWVKDYIVRPDPISMVQPFVFTNQDGRTFSNKDVEGKVYVAEFFFTTCKALCPRMHGNMRQVYDRFKDEENFMIVSHTSEPENDSVPRLKVYADSMKVDTQRWTFLTGRKDSLYNMARLSYTIDNPEYNVRALTDPFIHTQFWALVNKKGEVMHVYDGLKQSETEDMISEIRRMLK